MKPIVTAVSQSPTHTMSKKNGSSITLLGSAKQVMLWSGCSGE